MPCSYTTPIKTKHLLQLPISASGGLKDKKPVIFWSEKSHPNARFHSKLFQQLRPSRQLPLQHQVGRRRAEN